MSRRLLPVMILAAMANLVAMAPPALAVRIDPELAAVLAAKQDSERVRVLMIFDQPNRPDPGLLAELDGATPEARRTRVLAELKRSALPIQQEALGLLAGANLKDHVSHVRTLYLAGALSFEGSRTAVAALASLPDNAELFYDRDRAVIEAVMPVNQAQAKVLPAATDTAWSVKFIGADRVWNLLGYDGTGVVVGHIDTGVWLAHPDLGGGIWTNPGEIAGNGIDDDGNGFIDDIRGWDFGDHDNNPDDNSASAGHGTHTAGTVIGRGVGSTLTGVAPGATLMPCKVWQAGGTGGSLGTIWAAEQYCVENGARIITMSLGFSGPIPSNFMRAERVNCENLRDAGVLLVNSAGNDRLNYALPLQLSLTARVPAPWNPLRVPFTSTGGVVTVGGTGYKNNTVYSGSSWGPAKWDDIDPYHDWPYQPGEGLTKPDIAAPGVGVNSTVIGGGYSGDTWNGTSMSCPHIAGVAALMLQKNPSLSPAGLDSLMELSALDLGTVGKDNTFGSGRVDAYAAVQAVPMSMMPDIVWSRIIPDPLGDAVLDAGETCGIVFELKNASPVAAATAVVAGLTVVSNPWVTVVGGSASFPSLATSGGLGTNSGAAFSLAVAAGAPQGTIFTMLLTVQAAGGFQRTFDIDWYVGLPEYRTHDLGGLALTVTDQGIIGYMSDAGTDGSGMTYQGGGSGLFVGSFWAGTDLDYVCARDYNGLGTETYEWRVSNSEPNGRVHDLGANSSDQTFYSVFTDAGHALSKPLRVEQASMTFAMPENDRFVILEYRVTNLGPTDLNDLYNGVFCDFDIDDSGANQGAIDASRNLTYLYSGTGPYYGIALLGETPATNLTMISNPVYVYPTSSILDTYRIRHLKATISTPTTAAPGDWSALTSSVMSLPANGGQAVVVYALVYGATLQELQDATDAASALYSPFVPIDDETPVRIFHLEQNHPNPFNPGTNIDYTVARTGHVRIEVFDLSGRRLRTLVDEIRSEGTHTTRWDGADESGIRAPSGTYFYRYDSGGETSSRKMLLVK